MLRHDEKLNKSKIRILGLISFLAGFAQASIVYVLSTYFKLSSGLENIGAFYLLAYTIILIIFLNLHKIVREIGKSDLFYGALSFKIIVLLGLLFVSPGVAGIILAIGYIISGSLEWVSLDMILESYSSDRMSGRIRGKYLTIMNAGILLGPFIATFILGKYGYYGIFLVLVVVNVIISAIGIKELNKVNHKFHGRLTTKDVLKKVFKRKNICRIFHISFVLDFFYALLIIYTPIYLINLGFSWSQIGIIFTWMLLPFIVLQYPVGVLADKKIGEKEMLAGAIILMGFSTLAIYFITSKTIIVWSLVLFSTRIGAALVEILRDSYFYKRIDGHDVDLINIFRISRPLAYILATGISVPWLMFFPLKSIFILVAGVVFSALGSLFYLADNKSEGEELKKSISSAMIKKES